MSLLTDSWASDGNRGYFYEPTSGSRPEDAMSVYQTRWWLEVARAEHIPLRRLQPAATSAWLRGRAYSVARSDPRDPAAPAVQRVTDALAALRELGLRRLPQRAASALAKLRRGGMYGANIGTAGDWGDTALVVSTLRSFDAPVPRVVERQLAAGLKRALVDTRDDDLFGFTIPVLSAVSTSQIAAHSTDLTDELSWVQGRLQFKSTLLRITGLDELQDVSNRLHVGESLPQSLCRSALSSSSVVDPHLIAIAEGLGCNIEVPVPPFSSIGWPSRASVANSLESSLDGVRLASMAGSVDQFRSALVAQMKAVWLPSIGASDPRLLDVAQLDQVLGTTSALPASRSKSKSTSTKISDLNAMMVFAARHTDAHVGIETISVPQLPSVGLGSAIFYQLLFETTGSQSARHDALKAVAGLTQGGGLLAETAHGTATLTATALGAWLNGTPLPLAVLKHSGLCSSAFVCKDQPSAKASQPELQVAGITAALASPVTDLYPLPV